MKHTVQVTFLTYPDEVEGDVHVGTRLTIIRNPDLAAAGVTAATGFAAAVELNGSLRTSLLGLGFLQLGRAMYHQSKQHVFVT